MSRALRLLMISAEVESLARTGGLGDVAEALSLALAERGAHVLLVTPRYGVTRVPRGASRWRGDVPTRFGWAPDDVRRVGVVELETIRFPSGGTRRVCLVDDPGLYDRQGLYGDANGVFGDNDLRFAVLSRASLEIGARVWDGGPDVVHAHDWHAAFSVIYGKLVMGEAWAKKPAVFTVHNLAFQGILDEGALDRFHIPRRAFRPEALMHQGHVNLMKGAMALADRITTVSPTYAREIVTSGGGMGLDVHLRAHAHRLVGILNGIDGRFDPRTDTALACRFDEETRERGRAECKRAIYAECELEPGEGPLFATVSRLTMQKGIDLVVPLLDELVARDARVLIVGQGDPELEEHLVRAARRYAGRVAVRIAFDPPLSRRVYSAADFFLVPSRFEPCGLTQMYAMRYGSVPIVTDVGGLHDTVDPIAPDDRAHGTGIVAPRADIHHLRMSCRAAFELYRDRGALAAVAARGMAKDFSWRVPSERYLALYRELA